MALHFPVKALRCAGGFRRIYRQGERHVPFKTLRLLAVLGLAVGLATMLGSAKAGAAAGADRYIVKLTDAPLASYRGGVPGLAATNPAATGKVKLDPTSAASKGYVEFLAGKQAAVLEALTTAI